MDEPRARIVEVQTSKAGGLRMLMQQHFGWQRERRNASARGTREAIFLREHTKLVERRQQIIERRGPLLRRPPSLAFQRQYGRQAFAIHQMTTCAKPRAAPTPCHSIERPGWQPTTAAR